MSPVDAPRMARARLFPPLTPEMTKALDRYPSILRKALGLRPSMERELPRQIRTLSLSLTAEREGGPRPGYLSDPRSLAAYVWYFLPWNLLRLSRLLPGLDLELPDNALVCDLGAGPLTLMQALWLSRPELRRQRLRFVCVDRSRRALDLGARLFAGLAGFDPTAPDALWRVRLVRGEFWQGLGEGAHLTAMINVANEMADSGREPLVERMDRLAGQLADSLAPNGRLLLVEPGTRLGWRCLEGMRRSFVEMGLGLLAPCPHDRPCPLVESRVRAWCHFSSATDGAPTWLTGLSNRSELPKDRLSLSFLLLRAGEGAGQPKAVRVISGPFALTDMPGSAVYGCSQSGLLVLCAPDRRPPRSGDLLAVDVPTEAPLDGKSGAPRVVLASTEDRRVEKTPRGAATFPAEAGSETPSRPPRSHPGAASRSGGRSGKHPVSKRSSPHARKGGPKRPRAPFGPRKNVRGRSDAAKN